MSIVAGGFDETRQSSRPGVVRLHGQDRPDGDLGIVPRAIVNGRIRPRDKALDTGLH